MAYQNIKNWRRMVAAAFLLPLLAAPPLIAQQQPAQQQPAQQQPAQQRPDQHAQQDAHGVRDSGEVSKVTQEVSKEIYSPFCPGKTLAMCPSGGASEVRQEIQVLAKEGLEKQDIKEAIIDKYGEEFRMVEPPAEA